MSNQKDTHILEKSEDYLQWTIYTLGLLMQKDCASTVQPLVPVTVNTVRAELVESGFTAEQLTVAMLVKNVQDRMDKQKIRLFKAAGIIDTQIAERHQHLIIGKDPHEMWTILRKRFQEISPMSVTDALLQVSKKKMIDYSSADKYCSAYKKVLNGTIGMLRDDSQLDAKGIEVIVQGYMIANTGETYVLLIAQLCRDWKNGTVDFVRTSKAIITYSVTPDKPKALQVKRQSQRANQTKTPSCTTSECITEGKANYHTPDQCWIKHPELQPKYPLRNMRTKGTARNTESKPNTEPNSKEATEQVYIDSWLDAVMALTDCKQEQWLLDNAANMHVCNQRGHFLNYADRPSTMTETIFSGISPERKTIRLQLAYEDGSAGAILTFHDVWYILQSPANLVSQGRLNDLGVHYNDESWHLYLKKSGQSIEYAPKVNNNFIVRILDLSKATVHLSQVAPRIFQWLQTAIFYTLQKILLTI